MRQRDAPLATARRSSRETGRLTRSTTTALPKNMSASSKPRRCQSTKCSLSTGRRRARPERASGMTNTQAETMVSLFANATISPACRAEMVGTIAAWPDVATTTISAWAASRGRRARWGRRARARRAGGRGRAGQAGVAGLVLVDLQLQRVGVLGGRQANDMEALGQRRQHLERAAANGAGRAQHHHAARRACGVHGQPRHSRKRAM